MMQGAVTTVSASARGYTTDRFDVNVEISEDHVMRVTETITVDFDTPRHGIFRNIPYDLGIYKISDISVEGDKYAVESSSENDVYQKIIQIGDADRTLTGRHTYKIHYSIVGYEDKSVTEDYLSLDVLPPNWQTAIGEASVKIHFPKEIDESAIMLYSGRYGLKGNYADIDMEYDNESKTMSIEGSNLYAGTAVTVRATLPQGYWQGAANRGWMRYPMMATLIAIPLIMFLLWLLFGRDPKIVKTVEFYPPEKMTPAEIGYVIDGSADTKDVVSMIMYFASKGYIQITEYEKDKFEVTRLTNIDSGEKVFAKTLFHALFEEGDQVKLDELPESFGDMFFVVTSQLKSNYRGKNSLFTKASRICRGAGMGLMFVPPIAAVVLAALSSFDYLYSVSLAPVIAFLAIGLFMMLITFDKRESYSKGKMKGMLFTASVFITLGVGISAWVTASLMESKMLALLVAASAVVTFVFVMLMHARTKQSARWQGQILGFKDFIKNAELEKLKLLVEEEPEYFYDIVPYAYVMGLSDKWAKKFEQIPTAPPSWYQGYGTNPTFSTLWYVHMMHNCSTSFYNGAISSIAGSGSGSDTGRGGIGGGFGGGGFSGGGFGGGGGGAW